MSGEALFCPCPASDDGRYCEDCPGTLSAPATPAGMMSAQMLAAGGVWRWIGGGMGAPSPIGLDTNELRARLCGAPDIFIDSVVALCLGAETAVLSAMRERARTD